MLFSSSLSKIWVCILVDRFNRFSFIKFHDHARAVSKFHINLEYFMQNWGLKTSPFTLDVLEKRQLTYQFSKILAFLQFWLTCAESKIVTNLIVHYICDICDEFCIIGSFIDVFGVFKQLIVFFSISLKFSLVIYFLKPKSSLVLVLKFRIFSLIELETLDILDWLEGSTKIKFLKTHSNQKKNNWAYSFS